MNSPTSTSIQFLLEVRIYQDLSFTRPTFRFDPSIITPSNKNRRERIDRNYGITVIKSTKNQRTDGFRFDDPARRRIELDSEDMLHLRILIVSLLSYPKNACHSRQGLELSRPIKHVDNGRFQIFHKAKLCDICQNETV
jgi:hypothetical protein